MTRKKEKRCWRKEKGVEAERGLEQRRDAEAGRG